MREFSTIYTSFWTGDTGRQITALGCEATTLALYLLSSEESNMIGLYRLPIPLISHRTHLDADSIRGYLARFAELNFAHYDERNEIVWVTTMASWQVLRAAKGEDALKPSDKRVKGIKRLLWSYRKCPFYQPFLDRYGMIFCLIDAPETKAEDSAQVENGKGHRSPLQAPSKPLARPSEDPPKPETETETGKRKKKILQKKRVQTATQTETEKKSAARTAPVVSFTVVDQDSPSSCPSPYEGEETTIESQQAITAGLSPPLSLWEWYLRRREFRLPCEDCVNHYQRAHWLGFHSETALLAHLRANGPPEADMKAIVAWWRAQRAARLH